MVEEINYRGYSGISGEDFEVNPEIINEISVAGSKRPLKQETIMAVASYLGGFNNNEKLSLEIVVKKMIDPVYHNYRIIYFEIEIRNVEELFSKTMPKPSYYSKDLFIVLKTIPKLSYHSKDLFVVRNESNNKRVTIKCDDRCLKEFVNSDCTKEIYFNNDRLIVEEKEFKGKSLKN